MSKSTVRLPSGEKYHWVGGTYVEEDALRIAERINEYDSNLKIQYLEKAASIGDPPFRVVELCRDGIERTVMYAWKLDKQLLDRVQAADTLHQDVQGMLDINNAKARLEQKRRYQELLLNAQEEALFVVKSPKDTLIVKDEVTGRKLKIRSTQPVEVMET